MAGETRLTAPARLISVEDAKLQLRVDQAEDDDRIGVLIDAATEQAEAYCRRRFVSQTWRQTFDGWSGDQLRLYFPPLASVQSVKYVDTAGTLQTLATSQYVVVTDEVPGIIVPAYGVTWPTARDERGAVRVEFTCGYGAAAAVPASIRQAVLEIAAAAYNLGTGSVAAAVAPDIPPTARALLAPYVFRRF